MANFHWKTSVVADAIRAALPQHNVATRSYPGGDHDTLPVQVQIGEEHFHIAGFDVEDVLADPDSALVEIIEVSDGQDSRGGLNSRNPAMIRAYAEIRIALEALIAGTDSYIVNSGDDYF